MRRKCIATCKTIFLTKKEGENCILSLKYRFHFLKKIFHYKHQFRKPKQNRAYEYLYCKGFHLTSHSLFTNNPNRRYKASQLELIGLIRQR
jgi:hypothetical protein